MIDEEDIFKCSISDTISSILNEGLDMHMSMWCIEKMCSNKDIFLTDEETQALHKVYIVFSRRLNNGT